SENIHSGFRGTGIVPFDPTKILHCITPLISQPQSRQSTPPIDAPFNNSISTSSPMSRTSRILNSKSDGKFSSRFQTDDIKSSVQRFQDETRRHRKSWPSVRPMSSYRRTIANPERANQ